MAITHSAYNFVSKYWRTELGMKLKDRLRPLKHRIVGKNGIYMAIERVEKLEKQAGHDVKVVFDVGAAIGEAALPMARAFPSAKLYCFEPIPAQFEKLKARTATFSDRITYFNHALFDVNDTAEFGIWKDHPDASSFLSELGQAEKISVVRKRLDDVVHSLGITHIDFLKIDVEGVEKEVLAGGEHALKMTDNVFVEISPLRKGLHNHDYIDVFEYLHRAGFSFEGVYGDYFFTKLLD
jgi:FkbM family methyltransferase